MHPTGYRLGITCCFCGGKLEIDEASLTTRCAHCGSALKIAREGGVRGYYVKQNALKREVKFQIERHLKKSGQQLVSRWGDISHVYLPFWRVNAVVFSIFENVSGINIIHSNYSLEAEDEEPQTEVRIVPKEVSFCANDALNWGIESLGIRTQVLKLNPLDSGFYESNHALPMTMDFKHAMDRFDKSVRSVGRLASKPGSHPESITVSPKGMPIYFPIWVVEFTNPSGRFVAQFDPLAKRVASIESGEVEIPRGCTTTQCRCDSIEIVPHRCPNCGNDLPESEDSSVYYCRNCCRLYAGTEHDYRQLRVSVPTGLEDGSTLFPFWVFDLSNAAFDAKGELMNALDLLGFSREKYFVPGFNIVNPSRMIRLVSHYNRCSQDIVFDDNPSSDYTFSDVTLTPEEAASLIVPLTMATKAARGFKLPDQTISGHSDFSDPELIWLPFALDRYFWCEQITGATIEKAAVRV